MRTVECTIPESGSEIKREISRIKRAGVIVAPRRVRVGKLFTCPTAQAMAEIIVMSGSRIAGIRTDFSFHQVGCKLQRKRIFINPRAVIKAEAAITRLTRRITDPTNPHPGSHHGISTADAEVCSKPYFVASSSNYIRNYHKRKVLFVFNRFF
jgi:hypothetical protein